MLLTADVVELALKRADLVQCIGNRVHITIADNRILSRPTAEEGPVGGIQVYDYVQTLSTGEKVFMSRFGYDEIIII